VVVVVVVVVESAIQYQCTVSTQLVHVYIPLKYEVF
jgi:hypothetical protein